jgi:hypothetical protein
MLISNVVYGITTPLKTLTSYLFTHPVQSITLGLAAQTIVSSATHIETDTANLTAITENLQACLANTEQLVSLLESYRKTPAPTPFPLQHPSTVNFRRRYPNRANRPKIEAQEKIISRKKQTMLACIEMIKNGQLELAKEKWKQLVQLDENNYWYISDVQEIIRSAYAASLNNVTHVLDFIRFAFPFIEQAAVGYETVIDEMKRNNQFQIEVRIKLGHLIRETMNLPNYVHTAPEDKTRFESLQRQTRLQEQERHNYKSQVIEKCILAIQNGHIALSSDEWDKITALDENGYWYREDIQHIVKSAYTNNLDNFAHVVAFIRYGLPFIDQSAVGYETLVEQMNHNGQLHTTEITELRRLVKEHMDMPNYPNIEQNYQTIFESLKRQLSANGRARREASQPINNSTQNVEKSEINNSTLPLDTTIQPFPLHREKASKNHTSTANLRHGSHRNTPAFFRISAPSAQNNETCTKDEITPASIRVHPHQ